jgi:hypothetical protein
MPISLIWLSLAAAIPTGQDASGSVEKLAACLEVGAVDARAACLESAARTLVNASRREQAAESKTAAERFGMPTARPALVARPKAVPLPRIEQLDGVVATVAQAPAGQWAFGLADGSRWVTQEGGLSEPPHVGQALIIKRAAMGSYRVIFNRERPVQVKRLG